MIIIKTCYAQFKYKKQGSVRVWYNQHRRKTCLCVPFQKYLLLLQKRNYNINDCFPYSEAYQNNML